MRARIVATALFGALALAACAQLPPVPPQPTTATTSAALIAYQALPIPTIAEVTLYRDTGMNEVETACAGWLAASAQRSNQLATSQSFTTNLTGLGAGAAALAGSASPIAGGIALFGAGVGNVLSAQQGLGLSDAQAGLILKAEDAYLPALPLPVDQSGNPSYAVADAQITRAWLWCTYFGASQLQTAASLAAIVTATPTSTMTPNIIGVRTMRSIPVISVQ